MATAVGPSTSAVALIEQGKKPDPHLSTVVVLAGALGVTVDELIGQAGPRKSKGK
jgi:hypothetical protein